MRKAKENIVGETLMFMLKTVRKEKPSVFFLFLLAFFSCDHIDPFTVLPDRLSCKSIVCGDKFHPGLPDQLFYGF